MSRAEYMREYRAKRKTKPSLTDFLTIRVDDLKRENARLTEEVARLKRELAQRPVTLAGGLVAEPTDRWTTEPAQRRARQAVIDAALAKVNRTARK